MTWIKQFVDVVLHLDKHLDSMVASMGPWIYVVLFAIIFCETGLVVTPFLPGDSLLFAVGAIAARPSGINLILIMALLIVGAILGDTVNYWAGRFFGPKVFKYEGKLLNKKHLEKTQSFYERYGGKTIIIARFVPIVRTFAPFVAGIGKMTYPKFMSFNVAGGILWIVSMTMSGFFFGNLEFVKKNFSAVVLAIIFISILPAVFEYLKERKRLR